MATTSATGTSTSVISHRQKGLIERDFKYRIEMTGGKYIGINWKKNTLHFVTPTGKRDSKIISFE